MGNIVSSLIMHPFQRQDVLMNLLFKAEENEEAAVAINLIDEQDGNLDQQVFNNHEMHPLPHLDIHPHLLHPDYLFEDNSRDNNPDLIIDPSKQDSPQNPQKLLRNQRFCQISRAKTNLSNLQGNEGKGMIEKTIGHVSVWFENQMIVWGGYNDQRDRDHRYLSADQLWIYNPLISKWFNRKGTERLVPVRDMPRGTSGATACVLDHFMYIFGGYTDIGNVNHLFRVNLSPLRYSQELSESAESSSQKVAPQVTFERVHVSNPEMSPIACDKGVSWAYLGKLYFFGGYGYEPDLEMIRHLPRGVRFLLDFSTESNERGWNNQLTCYDPVTNQWSYPQVKCEWPSPRAAHAAEIVGSNVYIFGGRHAGDRMNDLWKLDMETMTWIQLNFGSRHCPEGRSWHSLTAISSDELVLFGGLSRFRAPLSDCWLYSISMNRWTVVKTSAKVPRLWHSAVYSPTDDEILIYGGGFDDLFNPLHGDIYTNDLLAFRFSPKSLKRLAIESAAKQIALKKIAMPFKNDIPLFLRKIIEKKMETVL